MKRGRGFGAGRSQNDRRGGRGEPEGDPRRGHDGKNADPRHGYGRTGEELARRFLEQNGYSILQTNYRSRYGEIDIIARRQGIVAFIEVKARHSQRFGEPFEAVGHRKQNQIRRLAEMWVAAHSADRDLRQCRFRFDVISIRLSYRDERSGSHVPEVVSASSESDGIQHIEDAFR